MPVTLPTSADLRKVREQAVTVVNDAYGQARTPLLAAIGAGDLATSTVLEALNTARKGFDGRTDKVRKTVADLPKELEDLRKNLDLAVLREKLDPTELRRIVDEYFKNVQAKYSELAEKGEQALDKIKSTPQVKQALDQVNSTVETAQQRFDGVYDDAREVAEDVLGRVTRRTKDAPKTVDAEVEEPKADDVVTDIKNGGAAKPARKTTTRTTTTAARKPAAKAAPKAKAEGTES